MYKLIANTTQPPTSGLAGSNTVQELGNLSITDPTQNYSLFIYYDPLLTVKISYVNAETLETVGTLALSHATVDACLYLYYRYLTTPGTDGQESTTDTVNDSDILDDAGNARCVLGINLLLDGIMV